MSFEFLDTILDRLSKSTEKEAFAIQNTLYAICIVLNAAIESDACYSKGFIAIDDKTYDTSGHIFPADLIADYGFWTGLEGYCTQTASELFWVGTHAIMDSDSEFVNAFIKHIEDACAAKPEWNYYGTALDTAELLGEWLERAQKLFGLAVKAPIARAPKAFYKNTRRVHGRRALTPPRTSRPTAVTRSHKHAHK